MMPYLPGVVVVGVVVVEGVIVEVVISTKKTTCCTVSYTYKYPA